MSRDLDGKPIDPIQISRDVELGIIEERDRQSRAAEVDLFFDLAGGLAVCAKTGQLYRPEGQGYAATTMPQRAPTRPVISARSCRALV